MWTISLLATDECPKGPVRLLGVPRDPARGACSDPKVGRGSVLGAPEISAHGLEAFDARLAARPAAFEREPHRTLCGAGPSANRRRRGRWYTRAACTHSRRIRNRSRRGGALVFEQSVAADNHPRSPRCAGSLRSLPLNANVGPQRMRVRESHFRGGSVDSSWRGLAGSLGRAAARRLLCSRLATTARALGRQGARAWSAVVLETPG